MIGKLISLLQETRPFIMLVALVFGFMGAWLALADIIPLIKSVWVPKGSAQSHAIVGACLALIASGSDIKSGK